MMNMRQLPNICSLQASCSMVQAFIQWLTAILIVMTNSWRLFSVSRSLAIRQTYLAFVVRTTTRSASNDVLIRAATRLPTHKCMFKNKRPYWPKKRTVMYACVIHSSATNRETFSSILMWITTNHHAVSLLRHHSAPAAHAHSNALLSATLPRSTSVQRFATITSCTWV